VFDFHGDDLGKDRHEAEWLQDPFR
jgi:hypothetical protein